MKHSAHIFVLPVLTAALALAPATTGAQLLRVNWHPLSAQGSGGGRGYSRSSQGYLGIDIRDVSEDRLTTLKLKEAHGAEIVSIDHDGPAGKAGLREHDVILQLNGQAVEGEEQLRRILRETPAGHAVTIILSRDGQQQTISTQMADRATVEREAWEQRTTIPEPSAPSGYRGSGFFGGAPITMPPAGSPITAPPDPHAHSFVGTVILGSSYTGAALETIGPQLAQFFGSQGGNGLLVRSVDPNSPAANAGLRAGDVVVRANAIILTGLGDWSRLVREFKGRPLSVVVVRDKQEQTFILTPDSKKRSSIEREAIPLDLDPASNEARNSDCAFLWMN
jgi:S1-C subfamily serine protease